MIGFTKSGICELHDIVQMTPTSFEYKKDAIPESMDSNTESTRSGMTSSGSAQASESTSPINADYGMDASNNSIPQNSEMSSNFFKPLDISEFCGILLLMGDISVVSDCSINTGC